MKQISIDEWIQEEKGTGWKRIPGGSFVSWDSQGRNMPICVPVTKSDLMTDPDVICEGLVNIQGEKTLAYIGFKEWVSGPNDCFHEYELLQYKVKE